MSVTLSPSSQLGFQRPLTELVKRTLAVSNHNSSAVAFKVKTTAPKQYCVRPNTGRIEPGETVEVQVLLQPMKEDPPAGTKCRDKFLVQSVVITPEREGVALPDLWQLVEKDKASESVHEQKIRCTYLPAVGDANSTIPEETASKLEGSRSSPDPKSTAGAAAADSSFVSTLNGGPSDSARSPVAPSTTAVSSASALAPQDQRSEPSATTATTTGAPAYLTSTPPPTSSSAPEVPSTGTTSTRSTEPESSSAAAYVETAKEKASQAAVVAGGAVAGAAAAVGLPALANRIDGQERSTSSTTFGSPSSSSTGGNEVDQLRRELANARAEIKRFEAELSANGGGLRNRSAVASSSTTTGYSVSSPRAQGDSASQVVEMKGGEGVPVQVVAAISFSVFLFTWLFF